MADDEAPPEVIGLALSGADSAPPRFTSAC
jgi:hypothetical protein